jgi:ribosomal protein S18 acetylase RimI-like enzyme
MQLTPQPFDSSIFGGPVFRLALTAPGTAASPSGIEAAIADAVRQDARLVVTRIAAGEREVIETLERAGFVLVETLVTLEARIDGLVDFPARIRLAGTESARACADIAKHAFVFDRFHADSRIDPAIAAAMKENWVLNGFAGRAEACLVATADGDTAGFLLMLKQQDTLIVDLVAVARHHQGQGIGRDLLAATKSHAAALGATKVRVGTQAANEASLRLYISTGFEPVAEAATLHFIPEPWQYRPLVRT